MKKLAFLIFLTPSLVFADRLGGLKSNADVLLTTQAASSGGMIPGSTDYVQVSTGPTPQGGAFRISSGTITSFNSSMTIVGGTPYAPLPDNPLSVVGMTSKFLQFNIMNSSADTNSSADLVITSNLGNNTSGYVNLGINSSSYSATSFSITGSSDSYLYASNKNLAIGTADGGPDAWLKLFTGGTTADKLRAYITNTGTFSVVSSQFGIGGTTPTWNLGGAAQGYLKSNGATPPSLSFQTVTATDVASGILGSGVITSSVGAAAVGIGQLSALGTKNNTTYSRGDNVFAVIQATDIAAGKLGSTVIASSIAAAAINLGQLSALGTENNTTFLRGDNFFTIIKASDITAGIMGSGVVASSASAIMLVSSFPATAVTAGNYTNTNLTVNSQGMITLASNGTAGAGSSFSLAVSTGLNGVFPDLPISSSSVRTQLIFDSNTFTGSVTGGTTVFIALKNTALGYSSATIIADQTGIGTTFTTVTGSTLGINVKVSGDPVEVCFGLTYDENNATGGYGVINVFVDNVSQGAGTDGGVIAAGDGVVGLKQGVGTCIMTSTFSVGNHNIYLQAKDGSASTMDIKCASSKCFVTAFEIGSAFGSNTGGSDGNNFNNYLATATLSMGAQAMSNIGSSSSAFSTGGGLTVNSTFTVNQGIYLSNTVKTAAYIMTATDTVIIASNVATSGSLIITLPTATNKGQSITIIDGAFSTGTVLVQAASGQLIGGTTDQFRMYAPGQSIGLYADGGTNWMPNGPFPITPPFLGVPGDPNSTGIVTASTVYCNSVQVPAFVGVTGMQLNVSAQALQQQIGLYDALGVVVSTSAKTTIGTGKQIINFAKVGYLAPGNAWICFGGESATTSITKQAASTAPLGGCSFATSLPMPTSFTFPGCTQATNFYSMSALVGGGIR